MTHKLSDQLLESLSALVDNEASELELRRILKYIGADENLREQWRRYHIIGSALRRERDVSNANGIAESVMAAIAEEQMSVPQSADPQNINESAAKGAHRWKNWVGKSAVAASFAAVMVLGLGALDSGRSMLEHQPVIADSDIDLPVDLDSSVVASAPLGFDLPMPAGRTVASGFNGTPQSTDARARPILQHADDLTDPGTQDFLNYLLIEHIERSSVNGNLGLLPFARVSKMTESN